MIDCGAIHGGGEGGMHGVIVYVVGVAGLLALMSLLPAVAGRLRVPYAVVVAAVGVALGLAMELTPPAHGPMAEFLLSLRRMEMSAETLLYVFLPVLLFETAVAVPVRRLVEELGTVLLMAVVAVFVCTLFIGYALHLASGFGLVACLLLGTILATTDPGAVIGVFRDLGAPRRLTLLVEGESLLNDAAAISLFGLLMSLLAFGGHVSTENVVVSFSVAFIGGAAVGWAMGRTACLIVTFLDARPAAEISLTVAVAYLTYAVAERYVGVSGVVAVVAAALVVGSVGRTRISQATWGAMEHVWGQLGFWANSLIFMLTALMVPKLFTEVTWTEVGLIVVIALAALTARAVVLFGLLPALYRLGVTPKVSGSFKTVMLWGGLRGALSLTLALSVTESHLIAPELQRFVAVMAIGFVFLTLFLNGTTLRPLIGLMGFDRLSPIEAALRGRALAVALSGVRERVLTLGQCYSADVRIVEDIAREYDCRISGEGGGARADAEGEVEEVGSLTETELGLSAEDRAEIGMRILANREEEAFLRRFAEGTVSRPVVELLVGRAARLEDAVKAFGVDGYRRASARYLRFTRMIRWANWLHRRFGLNGPLAGRLTMRFEMLVTLRIVLEGLIDFCRTTLVSVLGRETAAELEGVLLVRREEVSRALEALRMQYPEFASIMQRQYLGRAALRLEEGEYRTLFAESVISEEVMGTLERDIARRRRALEEVPRLDLRLDVPTLLRRVPFFADLPPERLAEVARLLRPRLALPGETIIRQGERGDRMYFIASGSAEVLVPGLDRTIILGTGDVFGEMALLSRERRNADVRALGYGQFLTLHARDFHRLMRRDATLRAHIEAVAAARKSAGTKPSTVPANVPVPAEPGPVVGELPERASA